AQPASLQPMFALVDAHLRAGRPDQAVAFLQSVLKANPTNAEAHVLMGRTRLAMRAPEQALKSFKAAVEPQPRDANGYQALADLHLARKNNDEARKVIRAGLEVLPESPALRLAWANLLELGADYEAAIVEYEELLKAQPGSLVVANNLASLLAEQRTDK